MISFFNPWQKNHNAMSSEMQRITHQGNDLSVNSSFIRGQNGQEFFQNKDDSGKIYRIEGWCTWIKYGILKNFSNKWSECVLKIGNLSEKILVSRKDKEFILGQQLEGNKMFLQNHLEDVSVIYGNERGQEKICDYGIYRARGVFTWIKYAILKSFSSEWQELHLKIEAISEKVLVKKENVDRMTSLHLDEKPIFSK